MAFQFTGKSLITHHYRGLLQSQNRDASDRALLNLRKLHKKCDINNYEITLISIILTYTQNFAHFFDDRHFFFI